MKYIKFIGNILYAIIILFILVNGIIAISSLINRIGIEGPLNFIITLIITAYGISMFAYDIDSVYKKNR